MMFGLTVSLSFLTTVAGLNGVDFVPAVPIPTTLPGEPCGERYTCHREAVECRCDADDERVYVALDHDGDGVAEVTQHWVSLDPLELVRTYGSDATEIARFGSDGALAGVVLVRASRGQTIGFYPVAILPESASVLRMADLDAVHAAARVDVVDTDILRRLYPDMMLLRGVHETNYYEYSTVQSLLVINGPDAEPMRVIDHLFDSEGWDALFDEFAGVHLSSQQDAHDLAWVLSALVQQMFIRATVDIPNALVPQAVEGGVEVFLAHHGDDIWLRLDIDDERRLNGVRMVTR